MDPMTVGLEFELLVIPRSNSSSSPPEESKPIVPESCWSHFDLFGFLWREKAEELNQELKVNTIELN